VRYDGNGRDVNYPAKLHGKTVHLYTGRNTTQKWWRTDQIRGWEYCQGNTDYRTRTPTMNNFHVPMRGRLRHIGALQCVNTWYANQG
jgi:hypothetical protein